MAKKTEQPSKAEMVRQALAVGKEAPDDGVAFIKEKFGIDIDKPMFGSYKSQEKARKEKQAISAPRGPGRLAAPKAASVAPASVNGNPADLARQIKTLIAQYGAVAVSDMVAVFAE